MTTTQPKSDAVRHVLATAAQYLLGDAAQPTMGTKLTPALTFASALALTLTMSGAALAAPDVSGVAIGSSFADSKAAVMKVNSGYKMSDYQDKSGKVVGFYASQLQTVDGNTTQDNFAVLSNDAGKVWFVTRGQSFRSGDRIDYQTFLKSVKDKYGPFHLSSNGRFLTWQVDRNGKLYQGQLEKGPCWVPEAIGGRSGQSIGGVDSNSVVVPDRLNPKCGHEIVGSLMRDPKTGMVRSFTMTVIDTQDRVNLLQKNPQLTPAQQQQQALDAEKAKGNKPKL